VPYSSDFSQWTWGGDSNANNTTRVDNQSSPDGETNAALFTRNAGTGGFFTPKNLSVVLNQTYTYSIFIKKGTSSTIEIRNVSNSPQSLVVYNIDTDTFTTEQNATGSSVDYGNGWYRIAMTFEHLNTSTLLAQVRHTLEDGESMYVFGSQFENLSYATSYIPTNGATNTRLQDIATNSGNASLINSTEGVLYAEIAALADDGTNRIISLSENGNIGNRVNIFYTSGSNKVKFVVRVNNSNVFDDIITLSDIVAYNKIALKYKENDFAIWINGIKETEQLSGSTYSENTLDKLNFDQGSGSYPFYGNTKALAVYKEALTDANLRCLTYPNPVATTFDLDFDTIAEQFTFTRGSEATFVNAQGLIESTASNDAPRIDYSTGAKAFLLEPQSTNLVTQSELFNLVTQSELFSDSSWLKTSGATITSSYGISPSGLQNSTRLQLSTSNEQIYISLGTHSGNTEVASLYIKGVSGETVQFGVGNNIGQGNTITLDGNWQRITQESTSGTILIIGNKDATATDFEIWGAQVEQQSYATSYIPTSGASATRNQELCNNATPVINSEEGTLYAEISALADDNTYRFISASSGAYANSVRIGYFTTSNVVEFRVVSGGVSQGSLLYTLPNATDIIKIAGRYKQNDFSLWVNGTKVVTDTSGNVPVGLSELAFDDGNTSNNSPFFGNTKGLKYYPKALADVQLEDLTTI
jgi:hypothetical protein